MDEKHVITFLTADGKRFAHPLHHLGKSEKDLPLIAIDRWDLYLFIGHQMILTRRRRTVGRHFTKLT